MNMATSNVIFLLMASLHFCIELAELNWFVCKQMIRLRGLPKSVWADHISRACMAVEAVMPDHAASNEHMSAFEDKMAGHMHPGLFEMCNSWLQT